MPQDKIVYTLHDKDTGEQLGEYCRNYRTEYEWPSAQDAANRNWRGRPDPMPNVKDFDIRRWKVTYEEMP